MSRFVVDLPGIKLLAKFYENSMDGFGNTAQGAVRGKCMNLSRTRVICFFFDQNRFESFALMDDRVADIDTCQPVSFICRGAEENTFVSLVSSTLTKF